MSGKVKWGILSTAKIGLECVIPAIVKSEHAEVAAIGSRNKENAVRAASQFGIGSSYGSYEELLDDADVDCIYNPLPNHMHAEWTIKAIEKGKHVLCEKPMAITMDEMALIRKARDKYGVAVGEAFMVRSNPQWHHVKKLVDEGYIGELKAIQGFFGYFNDDPENIRNKYKDGGGALWDIGCYPITTSRFLTDEEPVRVLSTIDFDPVLGVDCLATAILEFPSCKVSFTVSTQVQAYQRMMIHGTKKVIEIKIPFNAPLESPMEIAVHRGDASERKNEMITIPARDQYEAMIDDFSEAVINKTAVPVSVENATLNVKTILAVFESAKKDGWVHL